MTTPLMMQIEVTQECPFSCPQCYNSCTVKSMPVDIVIRHINQAKELGVKRIVLNGGEPLVYKHIETIIDYTLEHELAVTFFTSGYGLSIDFIKKYANKRIDIYISLNGSSLEINSKSRDGFSYAIEAMQSFRQLGVPYGITWVARADNVMDFPNMYALATKYSADVIAIIPNRPSNKDEIISEMGVEDYEFLKKSILELRNGSVKILIDACYGMLSMLIGQVASKFTGCYAGRFSFSVDVDSNYRPCTHIPTSENYSTAHDYWLNSKILNNLRNSDNICIDCIHILKCSPCPLMLTSNNCDDVKRCVLYQRTSD